MKKGSSQFHVITRAPMKQARDFPALCNMAQKFIFVSGGWHLYTVVRYDIDRNSWARMPDMNVGRYTHGSCAIGTALYILCGEGSEGLLNSVEKLETSELDPRWQLI